MPLFNPLRKLESKEFPKKVTNTDVSIEITGQADGVPFLFIISINRTIESELHEPGEGNWSRISYLYSDFIDEWVQKPRMVRI